ncbi:MAG TPA: transglycosylase SLT domain-containing protein [Beijerinckiaceae bacterium]
MAPSRATGQAGRFAPLGAEVLALRAPGAHDRDTFVPVMARSLLVCAGVAAGVALGLGMHGNFEAVGPAQAAVPSEVNVFLRPRVSLFAPAERGTEPAAEVLFAAAPALSPFAPIDRVPSELLLPDGPAGNPDDILEFGPMRIRRHLVDTIIRAAKATDTDPILLMAIADKESSFSTGVKAKTSSATGLYQFIESTWLKTVRDFGTRHGLAKEAAAIVWSDDELVVADAAEKARILELRRDPYLSALLAAEMLKRDRTRIAKRIGRDLTDGETYLAHFLGPDDAEKFLQTVDGQPSAAAVKLLPKPARANRSIFYARAGRKLKGLSVAEVHGKFQKMMGLRLDRYRDVHRVASAAVGEAVQAEVPAQAE